MIDLIVYEIATGRVARQITVFDEYERDQNLREGEAYLLGSVNPATCYVKNGEVKAYPEKPQAHLSFDFAAEAWVDARSPEEISEELAEARQEAIFQINAAVGSARKNYITDIAGQDMLYIVKREEAAAYIADPDPDLSQYALIAKEVGVTAPTAYEVAQVWLYMNAALKPIAGELERLRLTGINAASSATTVIEIAEAREAFALGLAEFFNAASG